MNRDFTRNLVNQLKHHDTHSLTYNGHDVLFYKYKNVTWSLTLSILQIWVSLYPFSFLLFLKVCTIHTLEVFAINHVSHLYYLF